MTHPEGSMTITQYEYPVQGQGRRAVDDLAPGFYRDAHACIEWINSTPAGPFPPAMIMEKAGTRFGAPMMPPPV